MTEEDFKDLENIAVGRVYLNTNSDTFCNEILESYEPKIEYENGTTKNLEIKHNVREDGTEVWYLEIGFNAYGGRDIVSLIINGETLSTQVQTMCIAEGTLITLADGSQVPIEELTGKEKVLVWNMFEGKYEESDIAFIVNHGENKENREIIHMYFSDDTDIEVIYEHGFYDLDLNKFVQINRSNYQEYIGHKFVKQSENLYEEVKLERVEIENKETKVYELVTPKHLTCFTNGLYSISALLDDFVNTFEVDKETLKYNKEKMDRDIEQYGIVTYEEVKDKIPEKAFEIFNCQYMKIRSAKGLMSQEKFKKLINYFNRNITSLLKD